MLRLLIYLHKIKNYVSKRINFLILFLVSVLIGHSQFINGTVLDSESGLGIPFAKIYCIELQNGAKADSNGYWQLENTIDFQITLQISADEFDSKLLKFENAQQNITISLEPSHVHLDEIIVSTSSSKLQRNTTSPVDSRKIADLNKIEQTTLIDALSNMAGVYNMSTGNGISKPVIRGLSGMRVLTVQNGLRIENQQWGADHGFAVFDLGVDRVEVIKGPSSLIYGNDALGGVIYVVDEPYANSNKTEIQANTKFETNSMATINNLSYKTSKNNLRVAFYGGYFNRSDYQLPSGEFAKNSQNNGASFKSAIGYNKNNWVTNFRYQILHFRIGLPGHSHDADPDILSFITSNQSRKEARPAQIITNHLAQWENKFYFKKNELVTQLGFTSNELKEYEKVYTPVIDMNLQNFSYRFQWKHQLNENLNIVSGSQGMNQNNKNNPTAEEVLVTDADFLDLGFYSLLKGNFKLWNFQAGARFDQRSIKTLDKTPLFSKKFEGLNYSFGVSRSSEIFTVRLNTSSGFRPPHISELLANGVHHATAQYLIGDVNLFPERGKQMDFYVGIHQDHFEIIINPFINQINNFVYNNPTATTDSVSGLPIFNIQQTDATLSGGDLAFHFHPHLAHWLHFESNLSFLKTQDINKNPLPLIPQNRLNNILKIELNNEGKISLNTVSFQYAHYFEQNKISQNELSSDAYQLIHIGCSGKIESKHKINYTFGINNLLNKEYIDHISRLKPYGINNPGRNFYVKLNIMISKS